jgi:hypothetical protein
MSELLNIALPVQSWPAPHVRLSLATPLTSLAPCGEQLFAVGGNAVFAVDCDKPDGRCLPRFK